MDSKAFLQLLSAEQASVTGNLAVISEALKKKEMLFILLLFFVLIVIMIFI